MGYVALAAIVLVLCIVAWGRPSTIRDLEAGRQRMFDENDAAMRKHLSLEAPAVVEEHFATHPQLLDDNCPHLPQHRELVTAQTGPMGSVEVVSHLCRLCGAQTYIEG